MHIYTQIRYESNGERHIRAVFQGRRSSGNREELRFFRRPSIFKAHGFHVGKHRGPMRFTALFIDARATNSYNAEVRFQKPRTRCGQDAMREGVQAFDHRHRGGTRAVRTRHF